MHGRMPQLLSDILYYNTLMYPLPRPGYEASVYSTDDPLTIVTF